MGERWRFCKMQGLGNDFVVIDATKRPFSQPPDAIRRLADRRFGVGFDQLLLVEPPPGGDFDFSYRIFNADGGEVGQCGNGARCFARFVREQGLSDRDRLRVATVGGALELRLRSDGQVTVDMGRPRLEPRDVPLLVAQRASAYKLVVGDEAVEFGAVSMGNPHAVLRVPDVELAPVEQLGRALQAHPAFPESVNVGFMQICDTAEVRLRVFERGSGETPACGSGACAAVVVGRLRGWLDESVKVFLPGGSLSVRWPGGSCPVEMTGPAERVFDGNIEL